MDCISCCNWYILLAATLGWEVAEVRERPSGDADRCRRLRCSTACCRPSGSWLALAMALWCRAESEWVRRQVVSAGGDR